MPHNSLGCHQTQKAWHLVLQLLVSWMAMMLLIGCSPPFETETGVNTQITPGDASQFPTLTEVFSAATASPDQIATLTPVSTLTPEQMPPLTPTVPSKVNVALLGQIGGTSEALTIANQYIYLGVGPRLMILDITTPDDPQLKGLTEIFSGVVSGVTVNEGYIYVVTKTGFFGIIVNDPTKPQLIGSLELQIPVSRFAIADGYAYVAGGKAGLLVIDLNDKTMPKQVRSVSTLYDASAISVVDHYVYLIEQNALGINGALQVLDISDPTSPQVVSTLELPYFAQAIAVEGKYAYLASNGLIVVDISDPSAPRQLGKLEEDEFYDEVTLVDGYAFISTNQYCDVIPVCPRKVKVIDIRDPQNPQVTNLPLPNTNWPEVGLGRKSVVYNGMLYIATESGLHILNAETFERIGQYQPVGLVDDLAIWSGFGYAVDGYNGFHIIDVNDPPNLSQVSTSLCEGCAALNQVVVTNGYAYLGAWDAGFMTVDVQNVQQPFFLAQNEIGGGNILLEADGPTLSIIPDTTIFDPTIPPRLHIFDLQNPAQPSEMSSLQLSGNRYTKIVIANGYAYLGSEGRLEIIDVSHPNIPQFVVNYTTGPDTTNYRWSIEVDETYAYFVRQATTAPFQVELLVIDLTNLDQPQQIARIPLSQGGNDVAVSGDFVYALGFSGLSVVDLSNPAQPSEIGTAHYGGTKVIADKNYLYVAGGKAGLFILQVTLSE